MPSQSVSGINGWFMLGLTAHPKALASPAVIKSIASVIIVSAFLFIFLTSKI
jgi:hypothetical protein